MGISVYEKLRSDSRLGFLVSDGSGLELDNARLRSRVQELADLLETNGSRKVALIADNGIDWIIADLACDRADRCIVPLPLFFSAGQLVSAIVSSGVDTLLTDCPDRILPLLDGISDAWHIADAGQLAMFSLDPVGAVELPGGTRKITYTSGTTGTPRGVCLSAAQQLNVANSLIEATAIDRPRHLCLLPLSTLLENIAGVYAPLLNGGTVIVPALAEVGLDGSSRLNVPRFLKCITDHEPHTLILVPETLAVLVAAAENGWQAPGSLVFAAVGGGKVAASVIERAWSLGLPVYEGYGLSECGSVVSLNRPGANKPGTTGRPLPHLVVRVEDGEIVVSGATFLGYVGDPRSWNARSVRTGDLGYVDGDGCLNIEGRRRNILISSFGRNISPEWVESELLAGDVLDQAIVFGDAQAFCVALVVPRDPGTPEARLQNWIDRVNTRLPDYARIADWHRLDEPLSSRAGFMTDNGRPRRDLIAGHFVSVLEQMFQTPRKEIAI